MVKGRCGVCGHRLHSMTKAEATRAFWRTFGKLPPKRSKQICKDCYIANLETWVAILLAQQGQS